MLFVLFACSPPGSQVGITPARPTTADDLVVAPAPPKGAEWSWTWSRDGREVVDLRGDRVPAERTRRGQVWSVSVRSEGRERAAATVTIENAPPTLAVGLVPDPPRSGEPLTATVDASDPDGDPLSLDFEWTLDGVATAHTSPIVPAGVIRGGQAWQVRVTATDGTDFVTVGTAGRSENAAPAVISARVVPTVPTSGDVLTVDWTGVDADGDAVYVDVGWFVNDVPIDNGFQLSASFTQRGDRVRAEVIPNDGVNRGPSVTTADVFIANGPPLATGAVITPPTPTEASFVGCGLLGASDPDGDPVTANVRWFVRASLVAIGPVLTGASFDKGDAVACEATPTDSTDAGVPWMSPSVIVGNSRPVIGAVSLSPAVPYAGVPVVAVAEAVVDADGDPVSLETDWFVDGVPAGSGPSLVGLVRGQVVEAVVQGFDGDERSLPVASGPVVVGNAPPVVVRAAMIPAQPTSADDVVADVVVADADGDSVAWDVTWTADGVTVAEGAVLPAGLVAHGVELAYLVLPRDPDGFGAIAVSQVVVVGNGPPVVTGALIQPDPLTTFDTAACLPVGPSDPDGDVVNYGVLWWRNGVDAGTEPTLSGFTSGEVIRCILTPRDADGPGEAVWSAPIVVL